jgi:hypothetical protein
MQVPAAFAGARPKFGYFRAVYTSCPPVAGGSSSPLSDWIFS